MKQSKHFFLTSIVFSLCILLSIIQPGCKKTGSDQGTTVVPSPDYWPTNGWQVTSPEQQGMDSGLLADLLDNIRNTNTAIRAVLVIRNGYLVMEAYFHPFQQNFLHIIHSCTKSINSTLIGIAIDQGYIAGVDSTVLDFFPEYNTIANMSAWKQGLTLKHLLMMGTGMNARDSYLYNWEGLNNMQASADWTKYVLDLPMIHQPGTVFDYSNCASYLITALLQKAIDNTAIGFAHQHLFAHIGIPSYCVVWPDNAQEVNYGWGQMQLRPLDMAKFGFLFLHRGQWNGQQIVSENWVDQATRAQIDAGTLSDDYGYQWWIDNRGYYMALGYAGQYIIVNRARNLLVVLNSALADQDFPIPETLYNDYILPAVRSNSAISANTQSQTRMDNIISEIGNPTPSAVPTPPAIASVISGKIYNFNANDGGFHSIGLTFTVGADEAIMNFAYGDRDLQIAVGLDNVHRITYQQAYQRAAKGWWQDSTTFVVDYQLADYNQRSMIYLTFSSDGTAVHMLYRDDRSGPVTEVDGIAAN